MRSISSPAFMLLALLLVSLSPSASPAQTLASNSEQTDSKVQGTSSRRTAADVNNSKTIKRRLTEIFELCRNDRLDEVAAYFVYRGPDKSREWKDTLRADVPEEKRAAEDICLRIKGYLENSNEQVFGVVKVEREPEGPWHVIQVVFRQGNKSEKALFAFLPIKGSFAIGDID